MSENKLAARLQAVKSSPSQPNTGRSPSGDSSVGKPAARWEDKNRRATFHMPNVLLDTLDEFCQRSGRNKSEVVRSALGEYLDNNGD